MQHLQYQQYKNNIKMDIYSLQNQVKFDSNQNLYNLFEPSFVFRNDINMQEYIVSEDDEMRIDIIFKNMYNIDITILSNYLKNIDIILFINNIDNPLNIKKGMILNYPISSDDFDSFRYSVSETSSSNDITFQLATLNIIDKTTKLDKTRKDYIDNNYSLSPVILSSPRESVRIENGNFIIGGL